MTAYISPFRDRYNSYNSL